MNYSSIHQRFAERNSFQQSLQNSSSNSNPQTPVSPMSETGEMFINQDMLNQTSQSVNESVLYRHTVRRYNERKRGGFGFWGWQPEKLQFMLGPFPFLMCLCLYVLMQSLILAGYTPAVISTVEKRYNFLTTEAGLIISAYDIGSLCVVVFISYLGGSSHRPQYIAIGAMLVGVATLLMSLPQFLSFPYDPNGNNHGIENLKENFEKISGSMNDEERRNMAANLAAKNLNPKSILTSLTHDETICHANSSKFDENEGISCENQDLISSFQNRNDKSALYFVILFLANFFNGIGSTPIFTLGTSFLFDNVPSRSAPMYVGLLYLSGAIGPAAGYLICGLILKIYVDPWGHSDVPSNDPNYVGAWWLGYLIFGALIIVTGFPLFMYPRRLPKRPEDTKKPKEDRAPPAVSQSKSAKKAINDNNRMVLEGEMNLENSGPRDIGDTGSERNLINSSNVSMTDSDDNQSMDTTMSMSFGNNIRDMPMTTWRLISNPVFLFITLSATCEFTIVTAFMTFVPKYLEAQFSIAASTAAITCGAVLVPSAGVGIVLGSQLVKQFELTRTGCCKLVACLSCIAVCLFLPTFFIKCPKLDIVGIDVPYQNEHLRITKMAGWNGFIPDFEVVNADEFADEFADELSRETRMDRGKGFLDSRKQWMQDIDNTCNEYCGCAQPHQFMPVCWKEKQFTFFNPCLAGCTVKTKKNETDDKPNPFQIDEFEFSDCKCIGNKTLRETVTLSDGACPRDCSLVGFLAALFFVVAATSAAQTPALVATMTSVLPSERPLALGVQFLFYRALAYIPAPIYFGRVIDSACTLREPVGNCGEQGACELYDADKFRKIYFGILMGIKLLGMVLILISTYISRQRDIREEAEKEARDKEAGIDEEVDGFRSSNRRTRSENQTAGNGGGSAGVNAMNSRLRAYSPAVHHQVQHSVQDSTLGALHETNEEEN